MRRKKRRKKGTDLFYVLYGVRRQAYYHDSAPNEALHSDAPNNGAPESFLRWGSSRQGCGSGGVGVPLPSVARNGRLAYPGHGEVTNRDRLGRRSHGCCTGWFNHAGYQWVTFLLSLHSGSRGSPVFHHLACVRHLGSYGGQVLQREVNSGSTIGLQIVTDVDMPSSESIQAAELWSIHDVNQRTCNPGT
jgi:hypothetical protein